MKAALLAALIAVAGLANAAPSTNAPAPNVPSFEVDQEGLPLLRGEDQCPTCGYGEL